jgi:hypothetical protein
MWEVFFTAAAERWVMGLGDADFDTIIAAADLLQEREPALGRPTVDSIKGSRHRNMKELRAGSLRALFAFDPRRRAVVLVGGDKRGDWSGWYEHNVPIADDLYDAYLREETEA